MTLFMLYLVVLEQYPTWQHMWVLPIIFLLTLLGYASGLIVATLTVFVPDIRRAISLLLQLMFWGTPIVYVSSILPNWANIIVSLNPVYWGIDNLQRIFLLQPVDTEKLIALIGIDIAVLVSAIWLNKRLEADVRDLL
jgi:lipopolysaccharide transport system permease protein